MTQNRLETDIVIIGSGAGGAAIAGELARNGRTTMIVEAGPKRTDPAGSHVRNNTPSESQLPNIGLLLEDALVFPGLVEEAPGDITDWKVIYGIGGMFSYWACNCPTPHDAELSTCLSVEDWRALFDRVRELLGISTALGDGSARGGRIIDCLKRTVTGLPSDRGVQSMPIAATRSGSEVHFASTDNLLGFEYPSDNVALFSSHIAKKINFTGARATGVIVQPRGDGDPVEISANVVVVAAGTAGTPQLLAGSRVDAGLALGSYVFDHPAIGSRVVLRPEILDGVTSDDPQFTVWIPYSPSRPWHNQVCRFPSNPGAVELTVDQQETGDIFTFSSMDVVPENRLEFLLDQEDELGLPRIRGHYRLSSDDYARMGTGLNEHFQMASAIGDLINFRWAPNFFGPGWSTHFMGGCRMGAVDDGTSVVSPAGRLWRYDNIYIAGNSVHAVSNAGNPTMTTIAFALHTADSILKSHPG